MVEETRVYLYLLSIDYSLAKKAPVLVVDFAYYIENVRSITRYSNHYRVVEIVPLLELRSYRRRKSSYKVDKLSS